MRAWLLYVSRRVGALRCAGVLVVGLLLLGAGLAKAAGQQAQRPEFPFDRSRSAISGAPVRDWVLAVRPGGDGAKIVGGIGAHLVRTLDVAGSVLLISFDVPMGFDDLRARAAGFADITSLEPQVPLGIYARAAPTDPLVAAQWHLSYAAAPNVDIDLALVWSMTTGSPPVPIDGRGVTVGIVDAGFESSHPDLKANYLASASYDIINNTAVLSPAPTKTNTSPCWNMDLANDDFQFCHATVLAGIVGEVANNKKGGAGVAPMAKLADIRLLDGTGRTDAQEGMAEEQFADVIEAKNNSWGPCDYLGYYSSTTVFSYGDFVCNATSTSFPPARLLPVRPGSAMMAALTSVTDGDVADGGTGMVLTWAAGNGAAVVDRQNEAISPANPTYLYSGEWGGSDGWQCNRHVIDVAATDIDGKVAPYSAPGPCILVSAPGGSDGRADETVAGIVATDLIGTKNGYNPAASTTGEYTVKDMPQAVGTSFAAPMVAGTAALMLQVNPGLTYRDVMHILVNTARHIDTTDDAWHQNGAGHWVSQDYGFGLLDAAQAVTQARSWTNVGALASYVPTQTCHNITIPHNTTGITFGLPVTSRIKVEHVEVLVGVTTPSPGNLQVKVQSPMGTVPGGYPVVLGVPEMYRQEANLFYVYTTPYFWDELAPGTWFVTVVDAPKRSGALSVFGCASVNIYGTAY